MALTFRSSSQAHDTSFTSATLSVPAPVGAASGDLELVGFSTAYSVNTSVPNHVTPSGWSLAGSDYKLANIAGGAFNGCLSLYYRIAVSTPGAMTCQSDFSGVQQAMRLAYQNPLSSGAYGQVQYVGLVPAGTSFTIPSMTTTKANAVLILLVFLTNTYAANTPSGFSARVTDSSNGISAFDITQVAAGASGAITLDLPGSVDGYCVIAEFWPSVTGSTYNVGVAEGLSAADNSSSRKTTAAAQTETGTASDSVQGDRVYALSATEAGSVVDVSTGVKLTIGSVTETGNSVDVVGGGKLIVADLIEQAYANDYPATDGFVHVVSTAGGQTTPASATINCPVSPLVKQGDLELIWYESSVSASGNPVPTHGTPSGWTLRGTIQLPNFSGSTMKGRVTMYSRTAQAVPTDTTLSMSLSGSHSFVRSAYRNKLSGTAIGQSAQAVYASTQTLNIPAITTTLKNSLVTVFLAQSVMQDAGTDPSLIERANSMVYGVEMADQIVTIPGSTGNKTYTFGSAADGAYFITEWYAASSAAIATASSVEVLAAQDVLSSAKVAPASIVEVGNVQDTVTHDGTGAQLATVDEMLVVADQWASTAIFVPTMFETLSAQDIESAFLALTAGNVEVVVASDQSTASKLSNSIVGESGNAQDSMDGAGQNQGTISETSNAVDVASAVQTAAANASEALVSTDTVAGSKVTVAQVQEIYIPVDNQSQTSASGVVVTEAASTEDSASTYAAGTVMVSDDLDANDIVSGVAIMYATRSELLNVQDFVTAIQTSPASLLETIAATDHLSSVYVARATLQEILTSSDLITMTGGTSTLSVTEFANAVDSLTSSRTTAATLAEAIVSNDLVTVQRIVSGVVTEAILLQDVESVSMVALVQAEESGNVQDALVAASRLAVVMQEQAQLVEETDMLLGINLEVQEALSLTEQVNWLIVAWTTVRVMLFAEHSRNMVFDADTRQMQFAADSRSNQFPADDRTFIFPKVTPDELRSDES